MTGYVDWHQVGMAIRKEATMSADDPSAALEQWAKAERQATAGPWSVSQRHGIDIADEPWSEVKITAPDGTDIAATFISHILENPNDGDDIDFIVTARTAFPRLLAAIEAVLKRADDWERTAATLDGGTARANALLDVTASFREAITAELTGKGGSDG